MRQFEPLVKTLEEFIALAPKRKSKADDQIKKVLEVNKEFILGATTELSNTAIAKILDDGYKDKFEEVEKNNPKTRKKEKKKPTIRQTHIKKFLELNA